ncbi:MAG: BamA/TamA family outer membrane protein [Candidatus Solibacter usitatus]|nr:BamA/TamA family outer membrane protein [Candidatus Solibacter usitatus]
MAVTLPAAPWPLFQVTYDMARHVQSTLRMRLALCFLSVLPLLPAQEGDPNVNSRYVVEGVDVSARVKTRISGSLLSQLQKLAGEKFNQETVDALVKQIRKQLQGYKVVQRVAKGSKPEQVRVQFDAVRINKMRDVVWPRLAFHSKQNFTFGLQSDFDVDGNVFRFGALTDSNESLERYSGIRGGYDRVLLGGKLHAGVMVESYRAQCNDTLRVAVDKQNGVPGIYRTRLHIQPDAQAEVLPGVWVSAGISIQRIQTQFPAAHYEDSHALVSSLRLERRWDLQDYGKHGVEAGYGLRAATKMLGSDFLYTRHLMDARYWFRHRKEQVSATFSAGIINGRAPLFERFVLGNNDTLRGYNKFEIAPLGGDRLFHGSLDYRHHWFRAVYDVGTVYGHDRSNYTGVNKVRHSLAGGLTTSLKRDSFSFLVAFPLKDGRAEPIFIVGMNF